MISQTDEETFVEFDFKFFFSTSRVAEEDPVVDKLRLIDPYTGIVFSLNSGS